MNITEFNYSLLIPTRNRQQTAIYAIASALNTEYPLLQIVVSDNSDNDTLKHLLLEKGWLEKVTYFKTDRVLSMRDNWEKALDLATGDIVSVMGDDDAIMPDAFLRANWFFSKYEMDVFHSKYATYKWQSYPFPGRRQYLSFSYDTQFTLFTNPKMLLRAAYDYTYMPGTGPGLYYGFVKRAFLEHIKSIRGRWLVDSIPDQDSGYATLMYANAFGIGNRPLFVSGHSGASNSGGMRYKTTNQDNLNTFANESENELSQVCLGQVNSMRSVIVSAQLRLLDEARRVLNQPSLQLNYLGAFNYLLDGVAEGYEAVSFDNTLDKMKALATHWGIDCNVKYPEGFGIARSVWFDAGGALINAHMADKSKESIETTHTKQKIKHSIKFQNKSKKIDEVSEITKNTKTVINGQIAGFKTIMDAVNFLSACLPQLNDQEDADYVNYYWQHIQEKLSLRFEQATLLAKKGELESALDLFLSIVQIDSHHADANLAIGKIYIHQKDLLKASTFLAASLTSKPTQTALKLYINTLIKLDQEDEALLTLERVVASNKKIELQLYLFNLYKQLNLHEKLVSLGLKLAKLPEFSQSAGFWKILAESYQALSDLEQALYMAKKSLTIDTSPELTSLIAELEMQLKTRNTL